jgi:hypothetical protein
MRITLHIPDPLFRSGEKLARRLRLTRSALYAKAMEQYLAKLKRDEALTRELDRVYRKLDTRLDPAIMAAQLRTLPKEDW